MFNIYLFSENFSLINHFIEYSLLTKEFCMKEVSTIVPYSLFEINEDNSIVIIDNTKDRNFDSLLQKFSIINRRKLSVVYLCNNIKSEIQELLNTFYAYFVVEKTNFMDIVYKMKSVFNKERYYKNHICNHVHVILKQLQISQSNLGYKYLQKAILLKSFNEQLKMKELCVLVAKKYATTSTRVDRCMRTVLSTSQEKNAHCFEEMFHDTKISTMSFITILADDLRKELGD